MCLPMNFAGGSGGRPVRNVLGCKEVHQGAWRWQGTGGGRSASGRNNERVPARNTRSEPVPPERTQEEAQTGITGNTCRDC